MFSVKTVFIALYLTRFSFVQDENVTVQSNVQVTSHTVLVKMFFETDGEVGEPLYF